MPLTLETRSVDDVTVVRCSGRLVEGESAPLQKLLGDLIPQGPRIVLDLNGVDFIDSSGLGLLVRFLTRSQTARGDLKLCGVAGHVAVGLKITRLDTVLRVYDSEADALAAFHQRERPAMGSQGVRTDILCVEESADVLAYVRELLKRQGYGVATAASLADALTLLRATHPKVVVVRPSLRAKGRAAFERLGDTRIIELAEHFATDDAGQAGQQLLDEIRAVLA